VDESMKKKQDTKQPNKNINELKLEMLTEDPFIYETLIRRKTT